MPRSIGLAFLAVLNGSTVGAEENASAEEKEECARQYLETAPCGRQFPLLRDALTQQLPSEHDVEALQATVSVVLSKSYFKCPTEQMFAAAILSEGLGVPRDPGRAQTSYRKVAFYYEEPRSFEAATVFPHTHAFVADDLKEARSWAESLETMTAEEQFAEAARYATLDEDLASFSQAIGGGQRYPGGDGADRPGRRGRSRPP